jgi:acetylornithine/N-succinyldiaminopimelate aminotransferase
MIGIECERPASDVIKDCMDNGVLVIKAKQKVRLLPALNIDDKLLETAIEILKEACAK